MIMIQRTYVNAFKATMEILSDQDSKKMQMSSSIFSSDRLETLIKSAPQQHLLQDIFGGKVCHIVTCQMCKNSFERYESFFELKFRC